MKRKDNPETGYYAHVKGLKDAFSWWPSVPWSETLRDLKLFEYAFRRKDNVAVSKFGTPVKPVPIYLLMVGMDADSLAIEELVEGKQQTGFEFSDPLGERVSVRLPRGGEAVFISYADPVETAGGIVVPSFEISWQGNNGWPSDLPLCFLSKKVEQAVKNYGKLWVQEAILLNVSSEIRRKRQQDGLPARALMVTSVTGRNMETGMRGSFWGR